MNENNLIVENNSYRTINVNNKSVAIIPKDVVDKLDVVFNLEHGIQVKDYIISNQKEKIFELDGLKEMVESGSKKNIYLIPLIDNNLLNVSVDGNVRDGNYNVVFGAMGSIISDPMLDSYIEKKEERPTRVLLTNDAVKSFVDWAEEKKEVPGHNFIEGLTRDSWKQKLDNEKVVLEQPVQVNVVPNVNSNVIETPVQNEVKVEEAVIPQINEEVKPLEAQNSTVVATSGVASVVPQVSDNQVITNTVVQEPIKEAPIVSIGDFKSGVVPVENSNNSFEFSGAPIERSQEVNVPVMENGKARVLSKVGRAGFVKFPIFLLTIMAIGSLGIFVGKMFYSYLSQQ